MSVLAGLCAGVTLYVIGRKGGRPLLGKYLKRHPKILPRAEAFTTNMRRHAGKSIFLAALTPVIRTLVAALAGIAGVKLKKYLFFATLGITVWNGALMLIGLYFSDLVLDRFG